jgi:transposase
MLSKSASRQRKTAAVLRLLRGEDFDTVSRSLGVTAATLTAWRDAFLAAGEAALVSRPGNGDELESQRSRPNSASRLHLLHHRVLIKGGYPAYGYPAYGYEGPGDRE